jgi:two-component system, chemotaxis family, CheB/CheR fusion protein
MNGIRILLVEDDDVDARLLGALLDEAGLSATLVRACRLGDVHELVTGDGFDCALVDLTLPDSQGLDTFRAVHTVLPDVPILILTGLDDTVVAHRAVREGAQDYLHKAELDGSTVALAIRYAIDRHETVHRLRQVIADQERLRAQLEGAVRVQEEFVAIAGHELRTPVTVIAGAAELLASKLPEELVGPECLTLLDALRRQAARLTALAGDLLLASHPPEGTDPSEVERVAVADLVVQAIEASGVTAKDVTVDVPGELQLLAVRDRLVRVVVNLLANAETHGAPPIEVRAWRDEDGIGLEIRDHGRGVDPRFVPYLFDAFTRADPSRGTGAGLGLRIVERLVADAGGTLRYVVPVDGGACFQVHLPEVARVLTATATRTRVLVVDDQVDERLVLRAMLEASGRFEVVAECEDGAEAIAEATRLQPDLVLLDLEMPGIDGLTALPALREAAPAARIVVLSGYPASRHAAEALAQGATGYLEKGLDSHDLVERLAGGPV